jgi:hypothetical protein
VFETAYDVSLIGVFEMFRFEMFRFEMFRLAAAVLEMLRFEMFSAAGSGFEMLRFEMFRFEMLRLEMLRIAGSTLEMFRFEMLSTWFGFEMFRNGIRVGRVPDLEARGVDLEGPDVGGAAVRLRERRHGALGVHHHRPREGSADLGDVDHEARGHVRRLREDRAGRAGARADRHVDRGLRARLEEGRLAARRLRHRHVERALLARQVLERHHERPLQGRREAA